MWTQDMFGVEKPIIALLHLDALPGDPGYCGDMKTVTEHARKDLLALQDGGVDGILFANEFSLPYQPVADIAVVSAMAYIIGKLKDEISVPFGVNVVKNPIATISDSDLLKERSLFCSSWLISISWGSICSGVMVDWELDNLRRISLFSGCMFFSLGSF